MRVAGGDPRSEAGVRQALALVPEDEAVPGALTPRQLVRYRAELYGISDRDAPDHALAEVALTDVADRRLEGFSKGMRQRAKVAAALVTRPTVVVLDEPLNGADPVQRASLIALFKQLGASGRTVIVSSHVLAEVERVSDRVGIIREGELVAVEPTHALIGKSFRHVELTFDAPVDPGPFEKLPGIRDLEASGARLSFTLYDDLDEMVKLAGRHRLVGMEYERPSLEEIFLTYYGQGDEP